MKHTPGPWVATTDGWISAALPTLDKLRVAKAALVRNADAHGGFTGDEVTTANELLLAAAPDLLAALKTLREVVSHDCAGFDAAEAERVHMLEHFAPAVLDASAAIAKAEGK